MKDAKIYGIDDMEYGHVYVRRYGEDYFTDMGPINNDHVISADVRVEKPLGVLAIINILLLYNDKTTGQILIQETLNSVTLNVYCHRGPSMYSFTILWDNVYGINDNVTMHLMSGGVDDTVNNYIFIVDVIPT